MSAKSAESGLGEQSLRYRIAQLLSLSVYGGVTERPASGYMLQLLRAALHGDEERLCSLWGGLCAYLIKDDSPRSLSAAVAAEVLEDENAFALKLAAGEVIPDALLQAATRDLSILYHAATDAEELLLACMEKQLAACLPRWDNAPASYPLDRPWNECTDALSAWHRRSGAGRFGAHRAFFWRDGSLAPVHHPDPIRLSDLKGYATQRRIILENTRAFLDGLEANNVLLYGDRGTGKSSTVKALLNEYDGEGLRMIEMPKEFLDDLPALTAELVGIPMKFIVFIDDLSFSGSDDRFAALKAVLEGGLASRPQNVLIYATSNRRHLLRETFSDRSGNEIHRADTVQESVSLSDRFGILLTFLIPDKQRFLEIVEQLADDHGLQVDRPTLLDAAEQWALERGARSPRYARQFISHVLARLNRGESL